MISNNRRYLEIIAVMLTGVGKIVFTNFLNQKLIFVVVTVLFWAGYIIIRISANKDLIKYWGLSRSNIHATLKIAGTIGIIFIILFIFYGILISDAQPGWSILLILLTYPIWGMIQQFLVMSLFAGNLRDLKGVKINYYVILVVTGILFSMVHYPSVPLIVATFVMAIFYAIIFLKYRNIIPLGFFHGILGGLFYLDPVSYLNKQ